MHGHDSWDLDVVRYFKNGKHFSLADRIDVARIFSKEVEHSEANLDLLEENMTFEEEFYVGHLAAQMQKPNEQDRAWYISPVLFVRVLVNTKICIV